MPRSTYLLALLALAVPYLGTGAPGVAAQDVEMLGERYGTPIPDGYARQRQADPAAFSFRRGWGGRGADVAFFEGARGPALTLGPRGSPVTGTFRVPVLLGMYSNSGGTPPVTRAALADAYFGAGPGTISHYYAEVSSDSIALVGDVAAWVQTARPDTAYTVGESGLVGGPLGGGGAGNFVYEVAQLVDQAGTVNWGLYDNDGPDGVPNSGDDDGYVDVLSVIHPTRGGECGGSGSADRIWSHRWSLASAVSAVYTTSTPRTGGGGFIKVDDYTIQPAVSCSEDGLNEIGVFTHELGHAFGLPDLYDTDRNNGLHNGAGVWDLMASGTWGCNNASPSTPCHMGAWTKAALGWVDVVTLGPDLDHGTLTLPPVETTGRVYRVDANDGSGEYFLLENRQRLGYDANLFSPGLLVWQIDPDWISARWGANRVNASAHMGVWLRQADGRDDLGLGRGRGDGGDPFPGSTGNDAFHTTTVPGSISYQGTATGMTAFDIAPSGSEDVSLRLLTRFTTVTVSPQGTAGTTGLFTVDGRQVDPPETTFTSPPFVDHLVEAVAGEDISPGTRRPFRSWQDDPAAPRARTVTTPVADTDFVAVYGGTQHQVTITATGGVNGVAPATYASTPSSPGLWFDESSEVTIQAVPRTGFSFLGWTEELAGQPNPATLTVTAPVSAGADFELVYAVTEGAVPLPAATQVAVQLQVENGTAPVTWRLVTGDLPLGLVFSRTGMLTGASLDLGTFALTVEAVDAIGLPGTGVVTLEVARPTIPIEQLTSPFLLGGPTLTDDQINFLNRQGNRIAPYDVGDFRAWLLASPELPLSADLGGAVYRATVTLRPASPDGVTQPTGDGRGNR